MLHKVSSLITPTFDLDRVCLSYSRRFILYLSFTFLTISCLLACNGDRSLGEEYLSGMDWNEPQVVTPGVQGSPPSDAVVLFDGKDLTAWKNGEQWDVSGGIATVGKGPLESKQHFGDCQLHLEWSAPKPTGGQDQDRSNSGLFFGPYELQILDSYQNKTYFDGQAGAIYLQTPPMVNAMRPPLEWNLYDILWTTPQFNADGSLKSPAFITAFHNGVVILNHYELQGDTPYNRQPKYLKHNARLPILLQDHDHPVRFRNIWVREQTPIVGKRIREPYIIGDDGKERPVTP